MRALTVFCSSQSASLVKSRVTVSSKIVLGPLHCDGVGTSRVVGGGVGGGVVGGGGGVGRGTVNENNIVTHVHKVIALQSRLNIQCRVFSAL